MTDSYWTIDQSAQVEIKVKGSRFLGFAARASNKEQAERIVSERSERYFDATHNCFAYVVGLDAAGPFRYSDDGEPSGTAGRPILDAIQGRGLTETVCVVTRYFGGTKLGTGGLVRAYGRCAQETLDACRIVQRFRTRRFRLRFAYELTGSVMPVLSKYQAAVRDTQYGEETVLDVEVRLSLAGRLEEAIRNGSGGRVSIQTR